VWCALFLACTGSVAAAQPAAPSGAADQSVQFLSRVALKLSGEHLSSDDPRFVWDTQFGGEIDVVDYGRGRGTFMGNYQAILGEELRKFDPNQGNYELVYSMSLRLEAYEVAAVFYHQSRHLSDRVKRGAVDWNMLGGRVARTWHAGDGQVAWRADLRKSLLTSFVDYTWELDTRLRAQRPLASHLELFGGGGLRVLGVDGTRDRGTQAGYRGEGGVSVTGKAGALELFVAVERRVDPYQLQFYTADWLIAGFRLVSR
jgi:hypothetical protein